MYVPHFEAFLDNIGITRDEFEASMSVSVPVGLLKMLLRIVVATGDFNKTGYLVENADIAAAVHAQDLNPLRHYIEFGFLEGRIGACPAVDEAWYRATYPDIDAAVVRGDLRSATEHFFVRGAAEGRAPNPRYLGDAQQWKVAFGLETV